MTSPYGRSNQQDKKGYLTVANSFMKLPYCLLKADDFLALDPIAVKVYFMILKHWRTHRPDEPVEISITQMRKESGKEGNRRLGRNTIMKGIKQLITFGFIHKHSRRKYGNKYYIEQKWFTGEYR